MTKIFECAICKRAENKKKGWFRFTGTRKDVRKHIVKEHGIKGRKNFMNSPKKDLGQSLITQEMCVYEEESK